MESLTIFNLDNSEPLIVLGQDELGLKVIGGDASWAEKLQLSRFRDLKEIADYINSEQSNLQAVFNASDAAPQEQNPDEQLESRLEPSLKILKELLSRVQTRQMQEKAEEEDKPTETAQRSFGAQIVQKKPEPIYVSMDGDNIGNAVARAEEKDDEKTLQEMSNRINSGLDLFRQWTQDMGGFVVEEGGDEGLAKVPDTALDRIEDFRQKYFQIVGATVSVGVGSKISESTKARMLAKLRGKDQICVYDDSVPQELELRMGDQESSEGAKIRTAMEGPTDAAEGARYGEPKSDEAQPEQGTDQEYPESEDDKENDEQNDNDEQAITQTEGRQEEDQESPQAPAVQYPKYASPQGNEENPQAPAAQQEAAPAPQETGVPVDQGRGGADAGGGPDNGAPAPSENDAGEAEEEEQGPFAKNPKLLKKVSQLSQSGELKIPQTATGSLAYDNEIEGADYTDSEDPEFSKALAYVARYGNGGTQ